MAIILGENDLKQLYQTPAAMDELLNLIEDSLGAHGRARRSGGSSSRAAARENIGTPGQRPPGARTVGRYLPRFAVA